MTTTKQTKTKRGRKKKIFQIPVRYCPKAERVEVKIAPHTPTMGEALNYVYSMSEQDARKLFRELKKVWRAEKIQARYERKAKLAQEKAIKLREMKGEK